MIRLGDGTDESHTRMQNAINDYWAFTGELFEKTLLRRFTSTQVQQWTSAWTHDYLAAHPECQGELATCPNKPQASEYLRTRFEAEMDLQFVQEVQ